MIEDVDDWTEKRMSIKWLESRACVRPNAAGDRGASGPTWQPGDNAENKDGHRSACG